MMKDWLPWKLLLLYFKPYWFNINLCDSEKFKVVQMINFLNTVHRANASPGESVLIHGASGAVSIFNGMVENQIASLLSDL